MENLGLLDIDSFLSVSTIADLVIEASASSQSIEYRRSGDPGIESVAVVTSSEDPAEL
jgi:hypothetical protein